MPKSRPDPKSKPKTEGTNPLVGKWFHNFGEDGSTLKHQGCVLGQVGDGVFLVQLYDFVMGGPSDLKLFKLDEMLRWTFYVDDEDMRDAYQNRKR